MVLIGPLSFPGHVTLTARAVRFEPTAFNRKMGVDAWSMDVPALTQVRLTDGTLHLDAASGQRRLIGLGARIVYERLSALKGGGGAFASDERVLLHTLASVEVNDLLSAVGELTVTTRRIRFQPNRMDRMIWPNLAFEDTVDHIKGFAFTGVRLRLEVEVGARVLRVIGDAVPGLYGAVQGLSEVRAGSVSVEALEVVTTPASLWRGPVAHPGVLVQSGSRLAFVATGLLDSLVGMHALTDVSADSVQVLTLTGIVDQRIDIVAGPVRMVLSCSDIRARYDAMVAWLARHVSGPILMPDAPDRAAVLARVEAAIAPWRDAHSVPDGILQFSPAVGLSEGGPATPGWLLLVDDTLVWLPSRVPEARRVPVSLPLARERWIWGDDSEDIRADRDGRPYRWIVQAGVPFRSALFEQVERIKKKIALAWASSGTGVISDGQNRRDSYRVRVEEDNPAPFTVYSAARGGFVEVECKVVEVSLGGCSVRTTAEIPVGTLLRVDLAEGTKVHTVRATIAHRRHRMHDEGWMAGLVFVEPTSDFEVALRNLWFMLQQQQIRKLRGEDDAPAD